MKQYDPRYTQIGILALLLIVAVSTRGIQLSFAQFSLSVVTALACQYLGSVLSHKLYDWRSALITGFSLSLLLRVDHLAWAVAASALAIGAKFLIRIQQKHIFNPANFALVVLLLATDAVWVSAGQWGNELLLAFVLAVLAVLILSQTRQWDIAFSFLGLYSLALLARILYLGDPLTILMHQLSNGALLIFSFFMLSDPKTIPLTPWGRFYFSALVVLITFGLRFVAYVNEALFYALFMTSLAYALLKTLFRQKTLL